jgi:large subunit ribosomal protein L35
MPKKKTNKSAAKRLWKTARGKFKFARAGRGHLLTGKGRKRKRALRRGAVLSRADWKRMNELIST